MAIYHRVLTKGRYLFKCFNSLWAHTYTSLTLMLLYLYLLLWKKLSQVSVNATLFSKRGLRVEIPVKTRMLLNRRMVIVQENFTVFNLYYCNGDKIFHLCFLWEWIYLPLFLVKEKIFSSYKRISVFKGTKKLECILPDGTGRRVIQNNLNYPFNIVSYADHFYHTDWRRWAWPSGQAWKGKLFWRTQHLLYHVSNWL